MRVSVLELGFCISGFRREIFRFLKSFPAILNNLFFYFFGAKFSFRVFGICGLPRSSACANSFCVLPFSPVVVSEIHDWAIKKAVLCSWAGILWALHVGINNWTHNFMFLPQKINK